MDRVKIIDMIPVKSVKEFWDNVECMDVTVVMYKINTEGEDPPVIYANYSHLLPKGFDKGSPAKILNTIHTLIEKSKDTDFSLEKYLGIIWMKDGSWYELNSDADYECSGWRWHKRPVIPEILLKKASV